ncbi:hypothetical protein ACHAXT_003846 [Thalassiosira profunda]
MALALCLRTAASRRLAVSSATPSFVTPCASHQTCPSRRHSTTDAETSPPPPTTDDDDDDEERYLPPWSTAQPRNTSSKAFARFRQHVNPLSRRFQMPADLPQQWPHSDFDNVNLPLFLDIGCAKGGFLLELVGRRHGGREKEAKDDDYMNLSKDLFEDTTSDWLPSEMNYLGLEIRPGVSQYAQARVEKRGLNGNLSFVGCNANVDLGRLLTLYQESADAANEGDNRPAFVSIQFPDPHFKKAHNKRRVVTPALVATLAQFMKEGDVVFLQSDILDALEAMRERFVEEDGERYFDEWADPNGAKDDQVYGMSNPLGVPTEREVSVLKQGLPIYRTLFKRNGVTFDS